MRELSILIPCYYAQHNIGLLAEEIISTTTYATFELVLVNDGSQDGTADVLQALQQKYPGIITHIELDRNYGEFNATMCGFRHTTGQYVVVMDDDRQNPASEIRVLYDAIKNTGKAVVYGQYAEKMHGQVRNFGSMLASLITRQVYGIREKVQLNSFKIIRRDIVDKIISYHGPRPYIEGLILNNTREIGGALVRHLARQSGETNYTWLKLARYFICILSSHTLKVIYAAVLLLLALTAGIILLRKNPVCYWPVLLAGILVLGTTAILSLNYLRSNYSQAAAYGVRHITLRASDDVLSGDQQISG